MRIELEDRQAMLAAIIDSSHDAIISKTLAGIITSWNGSAKRMFGYDESEVIGKHISILIPTDRLNEENIIISNIASGKKVDHFETIRLRKDGSEINISLTISPIRDATGKIIGASKIARDITEQLEIREKLRQYNEELEKINSYKDEFIGMASHELKTPLTSLTGYLQLLLRNVQNDKDKVFASKAVAQISRLTTLVSDLLDISKIQSGQLPLNYELFDLDDMIAETIGDVQQTTSHEIFFERSGTPKLLNGDRQRLEQVLINFLTNAIKYSPEAKKAIVTSSTQGDVIRFSVKDFGIGISKDQHDRIFSRYYRVQDTGPGFSGLGIGLYITAGIVSRHNGKIGLESEPGKGSEFWVELPIASPAA
ncbi:PAS domain S-box protein [Mucilaginibacter terrenus]|uniref:histidine kinase n=1 Tax=Mucilaginibacter terrenus TaxID=2482727 RepID=A0A3E2NXL8_9SPHI|nr:PAS domain-containing sensor histidine kinase [Mucilaginibacter terrenus]RFZ85600.1 PAS domain S-box protein [Mucilaginibacter terrenus]